MLHQTRMKKNNADLKDEEILNYFWLYPKAFQNFLITHFTDANEDYKSNSWYALIPWLSFGRRQMLFSQNLLVDPFTQFTFYLESMFIYS